jgi:transcriptional regulator with XRE-family HTH domain
MSDLKDYLSRAGMKQEAFALRVGVTQATVSKLIARTMTPSLELALKIEDATGGAVSARSWLPSPETQSEQPGALPDHKDVA